MPVAALGWIGLALAAAGTGVAVKGQIDAGNAADAASKRQQQAENLNAQAAMDAANLEAQQIRRKNLLRSGEQRAAGAKSGVLIDDFEGVMYDTSIQGELEAMSALYSGASAATYSRSRGANYRAEGRAAKSASRIQAGSTLLGGLSNTASMASDMPSFRGSTGSTGSGGRSYGSRYKEP